MHYLLHIFVSLAFAYRYYETHLRHYALLSLVLLLKVSDEGLLQARAEELTAWVVYLGLDLAMISNLILVLVPLSLFRSWLQSMPLGFTKTLSTRTLSWLYPLSFLSLSLGCHLLLLDFIVAAVVMIVSVVVYSISVLLQLYLIYSAWSCPDPGQTSLLYLETGNEKIAMNWQRKKCQLTRLFILTALSFWPALLDGIAAGVVVELPWWLWYGVALWPNALVGYDQALLEQEEDSY